MQIYYFFLICKKKCNFAVRKIIIPKNIATMKKLSIILMCIATLAFVACGGTGKTGTATNSDAAAKAAGKSTSTALIGLYNSYRANGTISLSNTLDLANALTVATGYTNYRNNQANAAYKTSFAAGMVAGGAGLITSANVNSIINTMNSVTGLNVNASNIANSVNTVTSIVTLLQALGAAQQ